MPTDSSPSPVPAPSHDDRPPRRVWLLIALGCLLVAFAGLWIGGGAAWLARRPLFASLRPIVLSTPPARPEGPTSLRPVDQAGVLVVLRDGQTLVSVDRNGRVMGLVDRSSERMRQVADVLTGGHLPKPAGVDELAGGLRPTLASSVPDIVSRPIEPVGTFVRDPRPTFRWRPQLGAAGYRVTVRDEHGAPVVTSGRISSTSWQSSTALTPGRTYSWTVEADSGKGAGDTAPSLTPSAAPAPAAAPSSTPPHADAASPDHALAPDASSSKATTSAVRGRASAPAAAASSPVAAARFRVLDPETVRALDARLALARRSNLLKSLAYLQAGLLAEAEQSLVALAADNEGSDRVRGLVEQMRAMRAVPAASAPSAASATPVATAPATPK